MVAMSPRGGRYLSTAVVLTVLVLLSVGIVMLASISTIRASVLYRDSFYFLRKQIIGALIALVGGILLSRLDYHLWQRPVMYLPLALVSLAGLLAVFIPGFGRKVGGSYRWIGVGGFSLQPSEFAKFAVVVLLSFWVVHVGRKIKSFKYGILLPFSALGVVLLLLLVEPDFGTAFLVGLAGIMILFRAGVQVSYLIAAVVVGGTLFALAVLRDPVRMGRILAFVMPDKYPEVAYHLSQSKLAFVNGKLFGVGLGNSIQKHFYLPEAHTDFIFAIIGEELGLLATGLILLLFGTMLFCGYRISILAPDRFGSLLAFGFTSLICLQAAINIGVVTGCLPTKGLPLPFVSYGGSHVIASVACIGVLLNIAQHARSASDDDHTRCVRDQNHVL